MSCVGGWSSTWPLDGDEASTSRRIRCRLDKEIQDVRAGAPAKLGTAGLIGIEDAGDAGHLALHRRGRVGAVGHGEIVVSGRQAVAQGGVGEQGDRPVGALRGIECVVIAGEKDERAVARIELVQADARVQRRADPAREDLGKHGVSTGPGDLEMIEVHLVGGTNCGSGLVGSGDRLGLKDGSTPMAPLHLNDPGARHIAQFSSRGRRVIRAWSRPPTPSMPSTRNEKDTSAPAGCAVS